MLGVSLATPFVDYPRLIFHLASEQSPFATSDEWLKVSGLQIAQLQKTLPMKEFENMRYSLLAALDALPTLDDHLENLLILGIGFLIIIFALIAGAIILDGFSKACSSSADLLEHKSAKRKHKRRRTTFRKHEPPPLRVVKSDCDQIMPSLAHNALRRNAEASTTHELVTPTHTPSNIHLVKQKERA